MAVFFRAQTEVRQAVRNILCLHHAAQQDGRDNRPDSAFVCFSEDCHQPVGKFCGGHTFEVIPVQLADVESHLVRKDGERTDFFRIGLFVKAVEAGQILSLPFASLPCGFYLLRVGSQVVKVAI